MDDGCVRCMPVYTQVVDKNFFPFFFYRDIAAA
jgi:hypothetical protein